MLKSFTAPKVRFTDQFNAFCRSIHAPKLTFKGLGVLASDILIDGVVVGMVVESARADFWFVPISTGNHHGPFGLSDAKSVFISLVVEGFTLPEAIVRVALESA